MRDAFESGDLKADRCIEGSENLADILAKKNTVVSAWLNKMMDGDI